MMRKRKKNSHRICDEVLRTVLFRMATRDAIRCTALSRHHRGSWAAYWFLHRRFGPPTLHPHMAYMVISMLPGQHNDFHLAGNNGLRRALISMRR
jgi:hypothetical protein